MSYNRRYEPKNKCAFEGCTNYKKMGCGKYCGEHRHLDAGFERKEAKAALKKQTPKIKQLMEVNDKLVPNTAAMEFQLQQNWFADKMRELSKHPFCENCNAKIPSIYFRHACAHILQKRKTYGFPSISCHPLNVLFLGSTCGCHNTYDATWEQASKMNIWSKAVTNFIEMYPCIDPSEHKNIPDILRQYIPQ